MMKMRDLGKLAAGGAGGVIAAAAWWRRHPSACPYGQRFWVQAPHPLITRSRLLEALKPVPGERLLEIGPGTGHYTLTVAHALAPTGSLEIFDVQREMLDHTLARAREKGLENLVAMQGDAQALPYPDGWFDAAYLVCVLGEIPDQDAALSELRRVLRPGGRLVVGELLGDPHYVSPTSLHARAQRVGLRWRRRTGPRYGYFATLQAL